MIKRLLFISFALLVVVPLVAEAQVTKLPGFYGRVFSDVEGYAYGRMIPLDNDAPRGFGINASATILVDEDFNALAFSVGYGSSSGINPWRIDAFYDRVNPDAGGDANGYGLAGVYQVLSEEGLFAVNASASVEIVDDAFDFYSLAANGEVNLPGTDLAFGASLGFASADFEFGGSESDVTTAVEAIYRIDDIGMAISVNYNAESDVTDDGFGVTATWALSPTLPLPRHSNVRFGVASDTLFVKYRARF